MENNKSVFTVKNVLRAISLLAIILVFCPSFLVSCSGQEVKVTTLKLVNGMTYNGERLADPYPIVLIALLLPVAMFIIFFIKKVNDIVKAAIVTGCAAGDLIFWIVLCAEVKKFTEENYCIFNVTFWFVLNIIVLILAIALSVLVLINKVLMETDLIAVISGGGTQDKLTQISDKVSKMTGAVTQLASSTASNKKAEDDAIEKIGFCSKCGSPIGYGFKFCIECGTPVPESMIVEAEEAKRQEEEKIRRQEEEARKRAEEEARRQEEEARKRAEEEARRQEEEAGKRAEEQTESPENAQNNNAPAVADTERPAFCKKCGSKLAEDAVFCEFCGTKIE